MFLSDFMSDGCVECMPTSGSRPMIRGTLAKGARSTLINARVNKTNIKGPQLRNVVPQELQQALLDISHQLKSSSPITSSTHYCQVQKQAAHAAATSEDGTIIELTVTDYSVWNKF